LQLVAHTRRRIEKNRKIERNIIGAEKRHVLLNAILEDGEVTRRQAGDELLCRIGDDNVERDEIDSSLERRRGGRLTHRRANRGTIVERRRVVVRRKGDLRLRVDRNSKTHHEQTQTLHDNLPAGDQLWPHRSASSVPVLAQRHFVVRLDNSLRFHASHQRRSVEQSTRATSRQSLCWPEVETGRAGTRLWSFDYTLCSTEAG
jgi:hypothetical protein